MKKLFNNKLYLKILVSDIISNFGDIVYYLALMNYALILPDSNLAISFITLSESLPFISTFLTGYFADKTKDKVKNIQLTLVIRIILYGIITYFIGLKPQMWILIMACVLNFFSDIAGQFENSLYYPITSRIVSKDDLEELIAFKQSIQSSTSILFETIGGILIAILSFRLLAFINVLSFIISLLIIISLKTTINKMLNQKPNTNNDNNEIEIKSNQSIKNIFSDIILNLKSSFELLINISKIRNTILIIQLVNASVSIIIPLVLLIIAKDSTAVFINNAYTISALSIAISVGSILGGFLTFAYLKRVSLSLIIKLETLSLLGLFISAYFHNIYGILLTIFLSYILLGVINPKMGSLIYSNIPENKLATIWGGIATFFQLGEILSRWLFAILIIILPSTLIIIIFIIIATISFLFTLKN